MAKHKKGLVRAFGLKMAIIIVMSAIIGSGVFKKVTPMAEVLGSSTLVVIAWILTGFVILLGVLAIAELAALFPHSGGAYSWLEKIYGKLPGFLFGWSCFTVIESAGIASVTFVFAGALNTFVPLPHLSSELESISVLGIHFLDNIGAKIVTCLTVIGLTIVNIRGVKKGGFISQVFTFSIVVCIALIIASAFGSSAGSKEIFMAPGENFPTEGFTFFTFITAMFIAMRHAFWAFKGWIALGFIGEEVKKPAKNMPKALVSGIAMIAILYALINAAYLYVTPIDDFVHALHADENNIAAVLAVDNILGKGGAYVVSAMILISTFGCSNAAILVSSRIYYAMARDGWFFRSVSKMHPKYRTPHRALILQCIWACILIMSGSFMILTDIVVIAASVFYALIVFGVIVLRKKRPDLKRPYKTFGYPVVPLVFTLFCVLLLGITFIEAPAKSAVGIGLILSGIPFYYYWKQKRQKEGYKKDKPALKKEDRGISQ